MPDVQIASGAHPEARERIVALHRDYYAEHWGFGSFFEAKVAADLAEFLERYQPGRDGLWTALADGRIEGAIAIDGVRAHTQGAHLRWFIVAESLQGRGVGGQLIRSAMDFCQACGYPEVHLWTFAGLDAARHLYEREGFELVEERVGSQWGTEVLEQRYVAALGSRTP